MTDVPVELVVEAGSWRYPEVRAAHDRGVELDPRTLAQLVASGLASRWSPSESVRELVRLGEFATASALLEELIDASELANDEAGRLADELKAARQEAIDLVARTQHKLADRASQVGVKVPSNEAVSVANTRRSDAMRLLDVEEQALETAESARCDELLKRAEQSGVPKGHPWRHHVQDLISHGEYRAAQQILDTDPDKFAPLLPLGAEEEFWQWDTADLVQVARWYEADGRGLRPSGFTRFMPKQNDADGLQIVAALSALADGSAAGPLMWLEAVTQLIGASVEVHSENADAAPAFSVAIPDDPRLPELPFVGRARYAIFVVGNPDEIPCGAEWTVFLTTDIRSRRQSNHSVVDVGTVLGLLADGRAGLEPSRDARRMRLLRRICSQREADQLITPASLRESRNLRSHIWWLLYLLGFEPSMSQVDAVLELSGAHPAALHVTLAMECDRSRKSFEDFDVSQTRVDPLFQDRIKTAVLSELSTAAAAVLFAMLAVDGDVRDMDDLRGALDLIDGDVASARSTEPSMLDAIMDVNAAVDELAHHGYLPFWNRGAAGREDLALCDCGVVRILKRRDPAATAMEALRAQIDEFRSDKSRASDEKLLREAARRVEHNLKFLVNELLHAEDSERGYEARAIKARQIKASWEADEGPIDVVKVCRATVRVLDTSDAIDIAGHYPATVPAVSGSPALLMFALIDIVGNAVQALRATTTDEPGSIFVTVKVLDDQPKVQIDIEDSGPGVPESVKESVWADRTPMSTKHPGPGLGLDAAKEWVGGLGGEVCLMPDNSSLGGAHFRVLLPAKSA